MIARLVIDGKLKKILQAQGKNPNPKELEIYKGIIFPGQYRERIREDIEFRTNIDATLGRWCSRTYTASLLMFIWFIITIIMI